VFSGDICYSFFLSFQNLFYIGIFKPCVFVEMDWHIRRTLLRERQKRWMDGEREREILVVLLCEIFRVWGSVRDFVFHR